MHTQNLRRIPRTQEECHSHWTILPVLLLQEGRRLVQGEWESEGGGSNVKKGWFEQIINYHYSVEGDYVQGAAARPAGECDNQETV